MGVKFKTLIKPYKTEIPNKELIMLKNKRIAVDTLNWLYQFLSAIRGEDGEALMNEAGNITSHLKGLFYRIIFLLDHGMKPIFVFDGKPHELKWDEINRRKEVRQEHEKKIQEALEEGDEEEAIKHAKATAHITTQIINESKELIEAFGLPYIDAIHDAESQCAYMVNKGDAWCVATQDYDAFSYNAARVIRNLAPSTKKKFYGVDVLICPELYETEKILKDLNLNQEKLVDLSIFIGNDYFPGFDGIGEKSAYNYLQKYTNIHEIFEKDDSKKIIDNKQNYVKAFIERVRQIFLNPAVKTDYNIEFKPINQDKIREILVKKNNFNPVRVETAIAKLFPKPQPNVKTLESYLKKK